MPSCQQMILIYTILFAFDSKVFLKKLSVYLIMLNVVHVFRFTKFCYDFIVKENKFTLIILSIDKSTTVYKNA